MRAVLLVVLLAAPLRAAEVAGKVIIDDTALPGCTVNIAAGSFQRTTTTNINGEYTFAGVPEGAAVLSFELAGFDSATRSIDVAGGSNAIAPQELRLPAPEEITLICRDCDLRPPQSQWDREACDTYDLNDALIAAADGGDPSALRLLQQRYASADTFAERHRIGATLLRRIPNDAEIWRELAEYAEQAVRFADADEELQRWCEERGLPAYDYSTMIVRAFAYASEDPRSKPILLRALKTNNGMFIHDAILGFAMQRDDSVLPEIERALQHEEAPSILTLAYFASDAADRVAEKYLDEEQCAEYAELRARIAAQR